MNLPLKLRRYKYSLRHIRRPFRWLRHTPSLLPTIYGGTMPMSKMFGIELEFFLIDHEGKIINQADALIRDAKRLQLDSEVKQECAHSMVEFVSFPHISQQAAFDRFFSDYETLLTRADRQGLALFHYGTYPGKNPVQMRSSPRYEAKRCILGEQEFLNAGRCIGFHCHYSLPSRSFSPATGFFFHDLSETKQKQVLNIFNLYIALDPALISLLQSSPYVEGRLWGKDARVMAYRGEPRFQFPHAVYARHPEFGTLNDFADDFSTLQQRVKERSANWRHLLREHSSSAVRFAKESDSILDSSWKPVKISAHETIESRSGDMNAINLVTAATTMLKHTSQFMQTARLTVLPCTVGDERPFTIEDDTLFVPRHETIRALQVAAAHHGLDHRGVARYCRRLLRFADSCVPAESKLALRPFATMLDDGKTTSDRIIEFVKRRQGRSAYRQIDELTAHELAITSAERAFKELVLAKRIFEHEHTDS